MKKSTLFLAFFILFIILYFKTNNSFAQYIKLRDCDNGSGSTPFGSLMYDGSFLYGMACGGAHGEGVIFKMKADGNAYTKLYEFFGGQYIGAPGGSLISVGPFLYGVGNCTNCNSGSSAVFKIKPDGTGYTEFTYMTGNNALGSLISDGSFLYGMTEAGGTYSNLGTIFKIKTDGTMDSNLLYFTGFSGSANGSSPCGDLISDSVFMYGMAYGGGINNYGTLFKIKPDGSGFSKLLDFAGSVNGSSPHGSLISDGNFLYGMTSAGGTHNHGTIFKIKPDGSGYVKLLDFNGVANGSNPNGSLIFDGTFLFGMTTEGGVFNDLGTIFKIKPDGSGYTKLMDFNGTNGGTPNGSLIIDGGFLYGMTMKGGTNNMGTIFKYDLSTGISENNMLINFNLYPNPTNNGWFTIEIDDMLKQANHEIYVTNVIGENIYSTQINSDKSQIDLSKQPNGIYFLNIKTEQGAISKKLIINK